MSVSCIGSVHPLLKGAPNKLVCNIVGGVISPLLANIALHGLEDLFHEWSLVGGERFLCETVETFPEPPKGYRKCKPANAKVSLRGPQKPRKTCRREPPKIYGPYPDGTWRTLRLVANDRRTRTPPAQRKDPGLRDLRLIRYADDCAPGNVGSR